MKVMGIDPSLNSTGYCVIEKRGERLILLEKGVIKTPAKNLQEKIWFLSKNIKAVIENHSPEEVAMECVFNSPFKKSSIILALTTGALISAVGEKERPLFQYSTTEVKKAITGWGRAGKSNVKKMIRKIIPIESDIEDDVSDAMAVAICHVFSSKKFKNLR